VLEQGCSKGPRKYTVKMILSFGPALKRCCLGRAQDMLGR
jgi:hypothetical protein